MQFVVISGKDITHLYGRATANSLEAKKLFICMDDFQLIASETRHFDKTILDFVYTVPSHF